MLFLCVYAVVALVLFIAYLSETDLGADRPIPLINIVLWPYVWVVGLYRWLFLAGTFTWRR